MPQRLAGAGRARWARGAHEATIPVGAGAAHTGGFAVQADDVAAGRRLVSEAGRRPGPAWGAVGTQPNPAVQTPAAQVPPVQTPAVQAPAVHAPAAQVSAAQ